MVTDVSGISLDEALSGKSIDVDTVVAARRRIRGLTQGHEEAKKMLGDWSSHGAKFGDAGTKAVVEGLLRFSLGEYDEAASVLGSASTTETGALILSWCHRECGRLERAEEAIETAWGRHKGSAALTLELASLKLEQKKVDEGLEILQACEDQLGELAEHKSLRAYARELNGEYDEALAAYRSILEETPDHAPTLFRLAYNEDLRGDPEKAKELYRQCASQNPAWSNAVINLGLIHEDQGEYNEAVECYQRVVRAEPTNRRARMFLGDAKASLTMYYDEEKQKRQDKRNQILKTPITDFELSVRSRNCLNKMNIKSLGDLIHKTEAELLTYKNFGETSLNEIKQMLSSKNLTLGMPREDGDEYVYEPPARTSEPEAGDEVLNRSVDSLELSGRGRKAMETLGVLTVGDLVAKTEAEMMTVKNFGYTSLNEVKKKLADLGLGFKE